MIIRLPETPIPCLSASSVASGVSSTRLAEPLQGVAVEGGGDAAAVGPWLVRAGLAPESEQLW